jgi:hypothetical protein
MAAFTACLAYLMTKSAQSGHFLEGLDPEAIGLLSLFAMLTIANPTIQLFHFLFVPKRKRHINAAHFLKDLDKVETSDEIDARLKSSTSSD